MGSAVRKRVLRREERAREWLVAVLRRVVEALDHVCFFCLMTEDSPRRLILVHKGELTAGLVEQDLVDHAVRSSRIPHGAVEDNEPHADHDGKHDRVRPIERIFLDQHCKDSERHQEPHVEQR